MHCSNYVLGAIRMNRLLDDIETIILGADRYTDEEEKYMVNKSNRITA